MTWKRLLGTTCWINVASAALVCLALVVPSLLPRAVPLVAFVTMLLTTLVPLLVTGLGVILTAHYPESLIGTLVLRGGQWLMRTFFIGTEG